MEIANSKNVNIEINQTPDTVINTEKTFGLKCPFSMYFSLCFFSPDSANPGEKLLLL